ncbi:hypothetical protein GPECTOR_59g686 [Gonium pectorale]|uniref:Uncharacterized protein n=1 Tax=Gonium pectorale TaxID=33097 RepID=A0A150G5F6_GONPE|nr:hypothetical protein GPECTOR_59g686 [Gonium pectorale]|eukprot:KXZ45077.1 hypothetical protein GPECTOR_59g686 [Gonium pectorale]
MADWSTTLDGLPGLSAAQKGKARFILMAKTEKQASLLVSGQPDVAAEAIKEMLEGAGVGGAGGAGTGGLGSPSATAEDDDVIVLPAAESRKYTGHMPHPVLDPETKEPVLDCKTKEPVLRATPRSSP